MAGIHKHIYKRRAMIQFGEEKGIGVPFTLSEMLDYMASYKGVNGKIHKSVASTPMQLSNLLWVHPQFHLTDTNATWVYLGHPTIYGGEEE